MHAAIAALRAANIIGYVTLAAVVFHGWRSRRDRISAWAALAFGSLGLLELLTLIPDHAGNLPERAVGRVEICLLVLFPYVLFRFATAFRPTRRRAENTLLALTAAVLVWTAALPSLPHSDESWSTGFRAYVAVFLLQWTALSALTATRLALAGRAEPTVARWRMHMLAFASAAITAALFLVAVSGAPTSRPALAAQALALVGLVSFFLGLSPPSVVRIWWRRPEQAHLQRALASLLTFASSQEEVAARVLGPAAAIVGARAIAVRNEEGVVVGSWNVADEARATIGGSVRGAAPDADVVDLEVPGGSIAVWTSPYAPFFGLEELDLLRTLGALTGLALDRVRLFEAEHQARLELERANELKASFVALAAHELRTPMTTIHGFVTTLHHLGDRLDGERQSQLRAGLIQQTQRMALLIEQLLDLSRLDAEAIAIEPEPLRVRDQVSKIVASSTPGMPGIEVDVADDVVAELDRNALDRIVSNLVTNALRYGAPPVVVHAEQTDRHFRLTVEDHGRGVPAEFVPNLFERFSRSDDSRSFASGTGLGLAIARSYAHAHGGELLYEQADPHGARFQLVLPTGGR
ncbi:MAG TPA: ATP-binding protein [Gaiellaceae bacterium]|nr:ATP-binding protein [Gaiellaceae bacterium]